MTKINAKELKVGQTLYYVGLNYVINPCVISQVNTLENGSVEVIFDDGCVELFDEREHRYMFLSHKEALDTAVGELKKLLKNLNEEQKSLDK